MPHIKAFLESPEHCRLSSFTLEFRLCGKNGCDICAKIGRSVRTPDVQVGDYNLQEEVLRWMEMPVPNPSDPNHYLSAKDAREVNDKKSHPWLLKHLPTKKDNDEEKISIQRSKNIDKKFSFAASKVRSVVDCDHCGAPRCIYSSSAVGQLGGPSKKQIEDMEATLENGYICGDEIKDGNGLLYARAANRCGTSIESQYYNPNAGLKGGRILTEDRCAICYTAEDIVSADEIRKKRDLGGKNPLLVCQYCFDKNFEIPCSGGRTNMKEKKDQANQTKKRQLDAAVQQGHRKGRKSS